MSQQDQVKFISKHLDLDGIAKAHKIPKDKVEEIMVRTSKFWDATSGPYERLVGAVSALNRELNKVVEEAVQAGAVETEMVRFTPLQVRSVRERVTKLANEVAAKDAAFLKEAANRIRGAVNKARSKVHNKDGTVFTVDPSDDRQIVIQYIVDLANLYAVANPYRNGDTEDKASRTRKMSALIFDMINEPTQYLDGYCLTMTTGIMKIDFKDYEQEKKPKGKEQKVARPSTSAFDVIQTA